MVSGGIHLALLVAPLVVGARLVPRIEAVIYAELVALEPQAPPPPVKPEATSPRPRPPVPSSPKPLVPPRLVEAKTPRSSPRPSRRSDSRFQRSHPARSRRRPPSRRDLTSKLSPPSALPRTSRSESPRPSRKGGRLRIRRGYERGGGERREIRISGEPAGRGLDVAPDAPQGTVAGGRPRWRQRYGRRVVKRQHGPRHHQDRHPARRIPSPSAISGDRSTSWDPGYDLASRFRVDRRPGTSVAWSGPRGMVIWTTRRPMESVVGASSLRGEATNPSPCGSSFPWSSVSSELIRDRAERVPGHRPTPGRLAILLFAMLAVLFTISSVYAPSGSAGDGTHASRVSDISDSIGSPKPAPCRGPRTGES